MQAEVQPYKDTATLLVFIEQRNGQPSIEQLLEALNGRAPNHWFRPRFGSQAEKFDLARFYDFESRAKRDEVIPFLKECFQDTPIDLNAWGVYPESGGIRLTAPQEKAEALLGAWQDLCRVLPRFFPQSIPPGQIWTIADTILAEWLSRLLARRAARQTTAPVSPLPVPSQGTTGSSPIRVAQAPAPVSAPNLVADAEPWLEALRTFCAEHATGRAVQALADLSPIVDLIREEAWMEADGRIYDVRRNPQPYDQPALIALELVVSVALAEWGRASLLLSGPTLPDLEEPLALRAAVQTLLHLGNIEQAADLLESRLVETPETDAEKLVWLLLAQVQQAAGRLPQALGLAIGSRFYTASLKSERDTLVASLAQQLGEQVERGEHLQDELSEVLKRVTEEEADLLGPLTRELALAQTNPNENGIDTPAVIDAAALEIVQVPNATERFAEILSIAPTEPNAAHLALLKLLLTHPGHPDEILWRLKLADLERQMKGEEGAVAACAEALSMYPHGLQHRPDARSIARSLRSILIYGTEEQRRNPILQEWWHEIAKETTDPALFLLEAELAVLRNDPVMASQFVEQGLPQRSQLYDLRAAVLAVAGINLPETFKGDLLLSLFRQFNSVHHDLTPTLAALLTVVEPLAVEALICLVASDAERRDPRTAEARLDHVIDELEKLPAGDGQKGPYADTLASLAGALEVGVSVLLAANDYAINADRLTAYVTLAMQAALAAGRLEQAGRLMERAESSQTLRFAPHNLVEVADTMYGYQGHLGAELVRMLVNTYRDAAVVLIDRLPQGDAMLLDVIVRTLSQIKSSEAEDLRALWNYKLQELGQATLQGPSSAIEYPLAGQKIAVAGGDAPNRRRAVDALRDRGASVVEVPPAYERHMSQDEINERLTGCDLVIEVWRQTKHQTSRAVQAALAHLDPRPALKYADGTGMSSIVRAALLWAQEIRPT